MFKAEERVWRDACLQAYEEINTPFSLKLALFLRYGEFIQLAEAKVDPLSYNDRELFSKDFMANELLRKFDALPGLTNRARKKSAIEKALATK